jgi:hypothetical protein
MDCGCLNWSENDWVLGKLSSAAQRVFVGLSAAMQTWTKFGHGLCRFWSHLRRCGQHNASAHVLLSLHPGPPTSARRPNAPKSLSPSRPQPCCHTTACPRPPPLPPPICCPRCASCYGMLLVAFARTSRQLGHHSSLAQASFRATCCGTHEVFDHLRDQFLGEILAT